MNFEQWQGGELPETEDLAIFKSFNDLMGSAFLSEEYYDYEENYFLYKNITFESGINIPDDAIESWDIGVSENENVIAYVVTNEEDSTYYDLYIQSDTQLYANEDMSYWFFGLNGIESIEGLELLDTSMTINMSCMFENAGYNNPNFTLDVSNFDTSSVTDMSGMFFGAGYNSQNFTLDVSNFDTSKVTNMSNMFNETGYSNSNFILDVSNFDTSNVTNMNHMFLGTGYNSQNFTLDVSNFDTSSVTGMNFMFVNTGYNSSNFTLDVSNFDTSSVTGMNYMFKNAGYNSIKLNTSITISNPNITVYHYMFNGVATKSGSKIIVNYTKDTEELVEKMIATKSSNSNVVKGALVS